MKRWMISLAPNRRTKFVSFTSRLVGKRHSTGPRNSSPLLQSTLFSLGLIPSPGCKGTFSLGSLYVCSIKTHLSLGLALTMLPSDVG